MKSRLGGISFFIGILFLKNAVENCCVFSSNYGLIFDRKEERTIQHALESAAIKVKLRLTDPREIAFLCFYFTKLTNDTLVFRRKQIWILVG
jgi:hypothetical protein